MQILISTKNIMENSTEFSTSFNFNTSDSMEKYTIQMTSYAVKVQYYSLYSVSVLSFFFLFSNILAIMYTGIKYYIHKNRSRCSMILYFFSQFASKVFQLTEKISIEKWIKQNEKKTGKKKKKTVFAKRFYNSSLQNPVFVSSICCCCSSLHLLQKLFA